MKSTLGNFEQDILSISCLFTFSRKARKSNKGDVAVADDEGVQSFERDNNVFYFDSNL